MKLAVKLLEDLKETRERLNQNPNNSSRPPSSIEPWVVAQIEEDTGDQEESDYKFYYHFKQNLSVVLGPMNYPLLTLVMPAFLKN